LGRLRRRILSSGQEKAAGRVAPADLKTFLDVFKVLREAPAAGG